MGDDVVLDAVVDRARDHAALDQISFGAVGPEAHNASGPACRHAWHFEQFAHAGMIDVDALFRGRSILRRFGCTRRVAILVLNPARGASAFKRDDRNRDRQHKVPEVG